MRLPGIAAPKIAASEKPRFSAILGGDVSRRLRAPTVGQISAFSGRVGSAEKSRFLKRRFSANFGGDVGRRQ